MKRCVVLIWLLVTCGCARNAERQLAATLDDRNWKRPILVAHDHEGAGAGLRINRHAELVVCHRGDVGRALAVLCVFARQQDLPRVWTEQLIEQSDIKSAGRDHQRIRRLLRRVERSDAHA